MRPQISQQQRAVVGDSRFARRQRREEREPAFRSPTRDGDAAGLPLARKRMIERVERQPRAVGPSEGARASAAVIAELGHEVGVLQSARQYRGDRVAAFRVEQRVLTTDDFADAGVVAPDRRGSACHRFHDRKTEAFVPRRKDEHLAQPVQIDEVGLGHEAGEHDVAGGESGLARRAKVGGFALGLYGTDDDELNSLSCDKRDFGEGLDRAAQVLSMIVAPRIEHEASGDTESVAQVVGTRRRHLGRREVRIDSAPDGMDRVRVNAEQVDRVAARSVGNREQKVALLDDVEVSEVRLPIDGVDEVELGKSQRDQVVQGRAEHATRNRRQRARHDALATESLAEVRDVQDVRLRRTPVRLDEFFRQRDAALGIGAFTAPEIGVGVGGLVVRARGRQLQAARHRAT